MSKNKQGRRIWSWILTIIFIAILGIFGLVSYFFFWDRSRPWGIVLIVGGAIALLLLGAAFFYSGRITEEARKKGKAWSAKKKAWYPEQLASFHERANHEDILHTRRLGLFLTFNAFLAVAVGVNDERFPTILFTVLGFVVGLLWILWAGNAAVLIRALRDASGGRVDEKLWDNLIRPLDEKLGPLSIFNTVIPTFLCLAWTSIALYHGYLEVFDP